MDSADLAKAAEVVRAKMDGVDAFGSKVRFDFGDGSSILVDGTTEPPSVAEDSADDADCTITAEASVFQDLVAGELDPTAAFMTGKISIDGDMGAAMAMSKILG